MRVKGITDEDFVNYKVPSMLISTSTCSFKCEKESGVECCQNSSLMKQKSIDIDDAIIIERYISNPITKAIVFGGLEPLDQYNEVLTFISLLRYEYNCMDDVVIYTGYKIYEVWDKIYCLSKLKNIVVKYGRYIPGQKPHLDKVLGVNLASDNQYAERI